MRRLIFIFNNSIFDARILYKISTIAGRHSLCIFYESVNNYFLFAANVVPLIGGYPHQNTSSIKLEHQFYHRTPVRFMVLRTPVLYRQNRCSIHRVRPWSWSAPYTPLFQGNGAYTPLARKNPKSRYSSTLIKFLIKFLIYAL